MTPNETQNELRDQLSQSQAEADAVASLLASHKSRRDASIDSATMSMSTRVHHALTQQTVSRPRFGFVPVASALSLATAAVVLFLSFGPTERPLTHAADTLVDARVDVSSAPSDVDGLADELVRRNSAGSDAWTITEADVDRLLGEVDLEL
ncbi:MAG: hypothetical protein FGM33_06170 [Candidatus Kapabacteria bacterium]|nr:hypothetical protein [Candidatus Kapabacteria bacterium]